jgi:hypothetical protein
VGGLITTLEVHGILFAQAARRARLTAGEDRAGQTYTAINKVDSDLGQEQWIWVWRGYCLDGQSSASSTYVGSVADILGHRQLLRPMPIYQCNLEQVDLQKGQQPMGTSRDA